MDKIVQRLIRSRIANPNEIIGCTPNQIEEIRLLAGGRLPPVYEVFLRKLGCGAGRFFEGTDIFYPQILTNRQGADALLQEDECEFQLSKSDFVFAIHQGYQFMYFDLSAVGDDPQVYSYMEGDGLPKIKWKHFSDLLLGAIEDYEKS